MKRGMSKLLSILLIATLVFTSASVAFAGTEEGQAAGDTVASVKDVAATGKDNVAAALQRQAAALAKSSATTKGAAEKTFKLVTLNTREDVEREEELLKPCVGAFAYTATDTVSKGYGHAEPITFPAKGTVRLYAGLLGGQTNVNFSLYKDAAMTTSVGYEKSVSTNYPVDTDLIQIPNPGTYYIGVNSRYCPEGAVAVNIAASYINGGDKTLTSGKEILIGQKEAQTNYLKFKATKNGYLTITPSKEAEYSQVTLCNSKKKAVSNAVYPKYATFGVKKGTTYYVKVASRYNGNGVYGITATNKPIKEKSGKNKAKAVTLKKNKKVKGTIVAGSNQADWYKFKLTKNIKQMKVFINGGTNGELKAKVYNSKGKAVGYNAASIHNTGRSYYLQISGKIKKGTYYIKVYRGNKKSSGYYTLSWK